MFLTLWDSTGYEYDTELDPTLTYMLLWLLAVSTGLTGHVALNLIFYQIIDNCVMGFHDASVKARSRTHCANFLQV